MFDYRDATALITGTSSGLGAVFASALAARGMHLILVARSQPTLEALARRLATQHGIHATAIAADLADPEAPDRIRARVVERGLPRTGDDQVLRSARRQPAEPGS